MLLEGLHRAAAEESADAIAAGLADPADGSISDVLDAIAGCRDDEVRVMAAIFVLDNARRRKAEEASDAEPATRLRRLIDDHAAKAEARLL